MSTSATIFEVLAEVDAKFAKIADKEYDSVSTEVKKWFKKLAVSARTSSCELSSRRRHFTVERGKKPR